MAGGFHWLKNPSPSRLAFVNTSLLNILQIIFLNSLLFFFVLIFLFYISFSFFLSGSLDFFFLTTHGTRINPEVRLMKNLFTREGFCAAMSDFNCTLVSKGSCNRITSSRVFMKTIKKKSSDVPASSSGPKLQKKEDSVSSKDPNQVFPT